MKLKDQSAEKLDFATQMLLAVTVAVYGNLTLVESAILN